MRQITELTRQQLLTDLADAVHAVREHAAEHAYRARATKAVGERVLHRYHDDHHGHALDLARRLQAHAEQLRGLEKLPAVRRPADHRPALSPARRTA